MCYGSSPAPARIWRPLSILPSGTNLSRAIAASDRVPAETHTREILGELGYRKSEIDEVEKTGLFI
jgi:hypothetical protein